MLQLLNTSANTMKLCSLFMQVLYLSLSVSRRPVPVDGPQKLCDEYETECITFGLCSIPECKQCTNQAANCITSNKTQPIPHTLPQDLQWLTLNYRGSIIHLDRNMFADLTDLTVLKLSGNISSIQPGTFQMHHQLNLLRVSNTHITGLPDYLFPDPSFNRMHTLEIPNNKLTYPPQNVFHLLKHVSTMDLSYNPLQLCNVQSIGEEFRKLSQLQSLSLAGVGRESHSRCNISVNLLAPLSKLVALDLSESHILQNNEHLISSLNSLRALTINNMDWYKSCPARANVLFRNLPATIDTINAQSWKTDQRISKECVLNSTSFASFHKLKKISLNFRYSDGIIGDSITYDLFAGLPLTQLDLGWCRITYIEDGVFDSVPHLSRLGLEGNQLGVRKFKLFSSVSKGYQLKDINLGNAGLFSDQSLQYGIGDILQISPSVSQLNLDDNRMEILPNFAGTHQINRNTYYKTTALHLNGNFIKYLSKNITKGLCSIMPHLEILSAKNNQIMDITGLCHSIWMLDLSDNRIGQSSEMNLQALKPLKNLSRLVMPRNGIRKLPSDMVKLMPRLKSFMMAGNEIRLIPLNFFSNNPKLSHLDLSDNELIAMDITMFCSDHLANIYLQGNLLKNISKEIMERLNILSTQHDLWMVFITGNAFDCTCDTYDFQNWIVSSPMIANIKNISCEGSDAQRIGNKVYNYQYTTFYCLWRLPIIITAIILLSMLMTSPLVLYTYKHRWYLCHIRVVFRAMVRSAKSVKREGLSKYDAFVSYDADNEFVSAWIVETMIPKLEREDESNYLSPSENVGMRCSCSAHLCKHSV